MRFGRAASVALLVFALAGVTPAPCIGQGEGKAAFDAFAEWRRDPSRAKLEFGDALKKYCEKLEAEGATAAAIERTRRVIVAHDEGELYDRVYSEPPTFNTGPNRLLVDTVTGLPAGRALDVGMGQGRNALYLASRGWQVTGFDASAVGVKQAQARALADGLELNAVHASDEEFDFGRERWDLIAIIYALEKRSVHRVRDALKPGGVVVVEAGLTDAAGTLFEYRTNELRQVFKGFRILRYEEPRARSDWGTKETRLVRLVAQKPD